MPLQHDDMPELASTKTRVDAIERRMDRDDIERREREKREHEERVAKLEEIRVELRDLAGLIRKQNGRVNALELEAKVGDAQASAQARLTEELGKRLDAYQQATAASLKAIETQLGSIVRTEAERAGRAKGVSLVAKEIWVVLLVGAGAIAGTLTTKLVEVLWR